MYKVINGKGTLLTTKNRDVAMLAATKYRWNMKHVVAMKFIRSKSFDAFVKELHKPTTYAILPEVMLLCEDEVRPGENIVLGYN